MMSSAAFVVANCNLKPATKLACGLASRMRHRFEIE
jgi:hypothetical protein